MMTDALFTPGMLGELPLKNKVIYPAMTRARCSGRVPVAENVKYYAARASAGLIVTEPSAVSELANGFINAPGMYNEEQARGWSQVTRALHDKGCTVVAQLWHTGQPRPIPAATGLNAHPLERNRPQPVASSAERISKRRRQNVALLIPQWREACRSVGRRCGARRQRCARMWRTGALARL